MAAGITQVDHIVVLMLENRSFDHMLGFLYTSEGNLSPSGQPYEGLTGSESNQDPSGNEVTVFQITPSTPSAYFMPGADPGEGYKATNDQLYPRPPARRGANDPASPAAAVTTPIPPAPVNPRQPRAALPSASRFSLSASPAPPSSPHQGLPASAASRPRIRHSKLSMTTESFYQHRPRMLIIQLMTSINQGRS